MVESNNAINNTVGASITGVTNTLTVTNASDTASSAARATITVGGTSAGDPSLNFNVSGTTDFEIGIDNTDSDSFKISASTALGTTDTFIMTTAGERTMPLQPCFLAILESNDNNVTGNATGFTLGSVTALVEKFDQGGDFVTSGTFTAPVTGKYFLTAQFKVGGITSAMTAGTMNIRTSNEVFPGGTLNPAAVRTITASADIVNFQVSVFADMDAADTSTTDISIHGGALVADVLGDTNGNTFFSGFLAV